MSAHLVDQMLSALGDDGVLGLGEPTHGAADVTAARAVLRWARRAVADVQA